MINQCGGVYCSGGISDESCRCSRWFSDTALYHSFRKTANLQGDLSVDSSCQPTSVNEDGWRCRSLDGRDGRKLPAGGSFISQSGSIISRWTCAKGCGWAQPATLQPAGFANKNLEPKQLMCVRLLSNFCVILYSFWGMCWLYPKNLYTSIR